MRVLIRCDVSRKIGLGHAMRSLALAQQLKQGGHQVFLVYRSMPATILHLWKKEAVKTQWVKGERASKADIKMVKKVIIENKIHWVIIDGYDFDLDYQEAIKQMDAQLLYIDDIPRRRYAADIILNQNPGFKRADYKNLKKTKLLLGPKYVLLRREFLSQRGSPKKVNGNGTVKKVLLTMGGSDPQNFTMKVLEALNKNFDHLNVEVLLGAANRHRDEFVKNIERGTWNKEKVTLEIDSPNVSQIMSRVDLAIHAAGSTSWELAYLGIPGLCYVLADNQLAVAKALEKRGCSINLGWVQEFSERKLINELKNLLFDPEKLHAMRKKAQTFVDGRGPRRVVEVLRHESKR